MFKTPHIFYHFAKNVTKNYYQILKITPKATNQDIKSSYKTLAKQYHPDINKGHQQAFKEINEAYQVLSDPVSKQQYDRTHFYEEKIQQNKYSSGNKPFDSTIDPRDQEILEQYRRMQEQYLEKYFKQKNQRGFSRNKDRYFYQDAQENRRFHEAIHKRQYEFKRHKKPLQPEEDPFYNQKFDRSKDSFFGFVGEQAKGVWKAWLQLKKKK